MKVQVEIGRRNRIWVRFPYSAGVVHALKKIGGASWLKAETEREKYLSGDSFWALPLDYNVCVKLRDAFGPALEIGPALSDWAWAERRKVEAVGQLHATEAAVAVPTPNCERYAPTIYRAMQARGYQTMAPALSSLAGPIFLADQPGTGKTLEMLACLIETGVRGRVLILAPKKALRATWEAQISLWLAEDFKYEIIVADSEEGSMLSRNALISGTGFHRARFDFQFVLINPESARIKLECPMGTCKGNKNDCGYRDQHTKTPVMPELFAEPWDAIILDETHRYLMNANDRSANVSQQGFGIQKLPLKDGGLKLGASGTPFKGKPRRFWPVLKWLRPDKYPGQTAWQEKYFETEPNAFAYGGKVITENLREDMREEFYRELSLIMIRRTKSELHKLNPEWAPPDKIRYPVRLTMGPQQAKAYKQMATAATAHLEDGSVMASGILSELTRLKQLASTYAVFMDTNKMRPAMPSCKWEWIKEFLDERGVLDGDGTGKYVIASQFTSILSAYEIELQKSGIDYFIITGDKVGSDDKSNFRKMKVEEVQDFWQNRTGSPRVLLLSTMAGGVSLTLDAADELVMNDETWNPDDQEQVEDRIHRTGRTDHQVVVWYLYTAGTIEELIADSNMTMDEVQKEVLDGRRGIEFAKQLVRASAVKESS